MYLQWVQDVAEAHWNAIADSAVKQKYNWVVLRHEIDYHSPGFAGDELVLRTWVYNCQGVRSTRIVQIIREADKKLLAEATTSWCLLLAATGKPARIGNDIRLLFSQEIM